MAATIEVTLSYKFSDIKNFVKKNGFKFTKIGEYVAGKYFIVVEMDNICIASFTLSAKYNLSISDRYRCGYFNKQYFRDLKQIR